MKARAVVGGVLRIALLPVVLLLPAGTLWWWEAWAQTAIFLGYAIGAVALLSGHDPELLAERMKSTLDRPATA